MAFKAGEFSPKQKDVMANCVETLNLLEGAVRSGKTICSIVAFINLIVTHPSGNVLFVGKTDRTLFRNILRPIEGTKGGLLNGLRAYEVQRDCSKTKHNRANTLELQTAPGI